MDNLVDVYNSDKNDPVKWDFNENVLYKTEIEGYTYKTRTNDTYKLKLMYAIRKDTDILVYRLKQLTRVNILQFYDLFASKIKKNVKFSQFDYINGINLFIKIHGESSDNLIKYPIFNRKGTSSLYLISEFPKNQRKFSGLNKPKYRYNSNEIPIGTDKSIRPTYRDVFLDLDLSYPELRDLIVHELAHTMANHDLFRPDDHGFDFKICEDLIKSISKQFNLYEYTDKIIDNIQFNTDYFR